MPTRDTLGGVLHTYQKYDPARIPPPRPPATDLVSDAMERLLEFGDLDDPEALGLTEEQLAEAVEITPEQLAMLGPSLDSLKRRLEEARRRILERYETTTVRKRARAAFHEAAREARPPARHAEAFARAVREEQLRRLERLWYAQEDEQGRFAARLTGLIDLLGEVYQIDELAAKWQFTGREKLSVEEALEVRARLEEIESLLRQLEEARRNAKVFLIDMDALGRHVEEGDLDDLGRVREQVREMLADLAARQGLERTPRGYALTPQALRTFQGKLLERIFSDLQPGRTGRHRADVTGDGAVELVPTRPYEFGDSVAHMDIPGTLVNALLRRAAGGESAGPLRLDPRDIEVHRTRNTPKCATSVVLDMSGSMRYGNLHVSVKKMALALQGLVNREFPGDFLQFIEMSSFAVPRPAGEIVKLMPKPVTVFDSVVRLRADMADPRISAADVPPHFTNIQHALQLSRQHLARQDTPNRQVILITDGLPTAHFEGSHLYLLYPPHARTEEATLREARACRREGIRVNVFLLSGWSQSREDIRFAYRLAEAAAGRVFFAAGRDLDRFVVWDYVARRRSIIG